MEAAAIMATVYLILNTCSSARTHTHACMHARRQSDLNVCMLAYKTVFCARVPIKSYN